MTDATINLDDIHAEGSVSVVTAGKPTVTAALSVDTLDFGRLTGGGSGAGAASSGPAVIDLSMLRLFDADIRLAANQLGYGDVKAGPATATLSVANGIAKLAIPQAGFYDGIVTANVTANGAGDVPAIDLAAAMDGVQGLPLLTAAAGFDRLEGRLKASVQVSGAGANTQAFARSLNGPVNVVFSDGAIRGIDVAGLIRNMQSLISAGYTQNAEAKTEFTELSVAVNIANGVGRAEDIRLLGPFVRMSGQGSIDLAAQTIDMRLDPRVVGSLDGQGGDFDVSGLGMPIIVTGALASPSIYPDISGILADPNRALLALSQLGGGVGELANGASGALGSLGESLGGEPGAAVTDLLGRLNGSPTDPGTDAAPANGQDLLNSVLGGVFGPSASAPAPSQQLPIETAPEENVPPPAPTAAIPPPRPDPRGTASVMSPPASEPAAPVPPTERSVDTTTPPQPAPGIETETTDLIRDLIQGIGQ